MCPICQCDSRSTDGVTLGKLLKLHRDLHKVWEESWEAVMNPSATQERPREKPLPIKNRRTDERTEYKKRSFKEKQAVKSLSLEFLWNGSGQKIFKQLHYTNQFQAHASFASFCTSCLDAYLDELIKRK